jgi:acetoin utilization deacetylase AcuC-like enzyme
VTTQNEPASERAPAADGPGPQPLPTALVLHADCGRHDTGWGHPEHQGRLPAVVKALERQTPEFLDRVLQVEGRHATTAELLRVHRPELLERVLAAVQEAQRVAGVVTVEADTVVSDASWDAALAAAGCAILAGDLVLSGQARTALSLSRPPGHHATPDHAMGFCLFNSTAAAPRAAQAGHGVERVLIIDWDVHHGNGTQDIFYDDPNVFFLSLHLENHYPGTGAADERGTGAGAGTTLNVPVPAGTSRADYRDRFATAVDTAFRASRPQLVIVSAGYDCLAGDPLGGLLLEPADMHAMTGLVMDQAAAADAAGVVVLLEGGYVPKRVGEAVVETLRAMADLPAQS